MTRRILPALASCLLVATAPTQDPPAKPEKPAAPRPSRNGGYLGIFFVEEARGDHAALRIRSVQPGSPAADLGLKANDLITAVDGEPFQNGDRFVRALWSQSQQRPKDGETTQHSLTLRRGAETVTLEGGLRELDARPAVGDKAPAFELRTADGTASVALTELLAKGKPVVLVFGSYT